MTIKSKYSSKKLSKRFLLFFIIIGIIIVFGLMTGLKYYNWIYNDNVNSEITNNAFIYIPNNATYSEVIDLLKFEKLLSNVNSFEWVAKIKGYDNTVKGGRYKILPDMSNNQIINMLRAGLQAPVSLTFNNIRTKEQLASKISNKIDVDSVELVQKLNDDSYLAQYGVSSETAPILFLPNTYQFFWNTNADGFIERMYSEYQKFWNSERTESAKELSLTLLEVSILASIVDEETTKEDEKPMVAGLYLNRLKKGIRLQADPTLKFAMGDFTVKRIVNKDKQIESPYNTYKYAGLPPGPIRIPSIKGIEAVLNPTKHNYLYMCAKEDFSGYHNFAKTLKQHNVNAAKYRRELNKKRIWR